MKRRDFIRKLTCFSLVPFVISNEKLIYGGFVPVNKTYVPLDIIAEWEIALAYQLKCELRKRIDSLLTQKFGVTLTVSY